jgi:hypothetical protein
MKISLTRVLIELKMLEKKIGQDYKKDFLGVFQAKDNRILDTSFNKEEFEKFAKSNYQSLDDKIKRYEKLKFALIKANSENTIKIKDQEKSIAGWIAYKEKILPIKTSLLENLKFKMNKMINAIEENKSYIELRIEDMLNKNLGKDRKADPQAYDTIAKPFIDQNIYKLADPANIKQKIEELTNEIDGLLIEINTSLSEANSKIEVEI